MSVVMSLFNTYIFNEIEDDVSPTCDLRLEPFLQRDLFCLLVYQIVLGVSEGSHDP
jgi:hypothetical protein